MIQEFVDEQPVFETHDNHQISRFEPSDPRYNNVMDSQGSNVALTNGLNADFLTLDEGRLSNLGQPMGLKPSKSSLLPMINQGGRNFDQDLPSYGENFTTLQGGLTNRSLGSTFRKTNVVQDNQVRIKGTTIEHQYETASLESQSVRFMPKDESNSMFRGIDADPEEEEYDYEYDDEYDEEDETIDKSSDPNSIGNRVD